MHLVNVILALPDTPVNTAILVKGAPNITSDVIRHSNRLDCTTISMIDQFFGILIH